MAISINVIGIFPFLVPVNDESIIKANTIPLLPKRAVFLKIKKFIIPVTTAVITTTMDIWAAPYFSSRSGPKSKIITMLELK